MNFFFRPLLILFWSGYQEIAPPDSIPPVRTVLLTLVGLFLFLMVLVYAGFKTFLEDRASFNEMTKAEKRTRVAGFLIGALSAILLIAIDSVPGSVAPLGTLAFVPWYILIVLGTVFGFSVAVISKLVAHFRATSGTGILLMVVTFISGAGLYLILFANGLQSKVLAAALPVFIGLLLFRMLFPSRPSSVGEKEPEENKLVTS